MSIRFQMMLSIIIVSLLTVGTSLGVSIYQFSDYAHETTLSEVGKALNGLADELDQRKQDAMVKGKLLAGQPGLAAAAGASDTAAVVALMSPLAREAGLDLLTVLDANGVVIARIHEPAKKSDNLGYLAHISS